MLEQLLYRNRPPLEAGISPYGSFLADTFKTSLIYGIYPLLTVLLFGKITIAIPRIVNIVQISYLRVIYISCLNFSEGQHKSLIRSVWRRGGEPMACTHTQTS